MELFILLSFVLILMTLTLGLWINHMNKELQAIKRLQVHLHLQYDKDFQEFLNKRKGE